MSAGFDEEILRASLVCGSSATDELRAACVTPTRVLHRRGRGRGRALLAQHLLGSQFGAMGAAQRAGAGADVPM